MYNECQRKCTWSLVTSSIAVPDPKAISFLFPQEDTSDCGRGASFRPSLRVLLSLQLLLLYLTVCCHPLLLTSCLWNIHLVLPVHFCFLHHLHLLQTCQREGQMPSPVNSGYTLAPPSWGLFLSTPRSPEALPIVLFLVSPPTSPRTSRVSAQQVVLIQSSEQDVGKHKSPRPSSHSQHPWALNHCCSSFYPMSYWPNTKEQWPQTSPHLHWIRGILGDLFQFSSFYCL